MTKQEATAIKKAVKEETGLNFTVYFNSKKGELRYTVCEWQDDSGESAEARKAREEKNIFGILNALTKRGLRPKYHRDSKRYQGFINCQYIIFE